MVFVLYIYYKCPQYLMCCILLRSGLGYRGYVCIDGLYSGEAIALLKKFYDTPNPHSEWLITDERLRD
jgi:hypothetical protein